MYHRSSFSGSALVSLESHWERLPAWAGSSKDGEVRKANRQREVSEEVLLGAHMLKARARVRGVEL